MPDEPTPPTPPVEPPPEKPEWAANIPDKFIRATQEESLVAMSQGYNALETRLGQPKPEEKPEEKPEPKPGDTLEIPEPTPPDESTLEGILAKAGLTGEDLAETWENDSKLTDAQYKALAEKSGIPRPAVDAYMQQSQAALVGREAVASQMRSEAAKMVGGDEQLQTLLNSANTFVPADEIEDLSERIKDPRRYKGAVRELLHHHSQAVESHKVQPLVTGQPSTTPSGGGFTTQSEFVEASQKVAAARAAGSPDLALEARLGATSSAVKAGGV